MLTEALEVKLEYCSKTLLPLREHHEPKVRRSRCWDEFASASKRDLQSLPRRHGADTHRCVDVSQHRLARLDRLSIIGPDLGDVGQVSEGMQGLANDAGITV